MSARLQTIGTAINSIINQTYKNLEIIVVDDNSTDNTYKLVEKLTDERIKLIKSPIDLYRFDKKLKFTYIFPKILDNSVLPQPGEPIITVCIKSLYSL